MAKKNTDGKSFNRTGKYDHENGTITVTDKNGVETKFDVVSKLASFHGEEISLGATTDMSPSDVVGEDSEDENGE